ncbi:MAG: NAD-dependent deacylase [Firmicutes bacterium]|nr:NAD-dependent deacylase [Bacillota bacterium]
MDKYKEAAVVIKKSKNIVVLTGAGISTESGIPDFRSPGEGLWTKMDPMEALSTKVLLEEPRKFYETGFKIITTMKDAKPNRAHEILAKMEQGGIIQLVITQNIDNLHFKAGSQNVYEVHGNSRSYTCMNCNKSYEISTIEEKVELNEIPPKCTCGGVIRPDVVMFGDMLPSCFYTGMRKVQEADLLIAIGTSLTVYPVSQLAEVCRKLMIINLSSTAYDYRSEVIINDNISEALTKIYSILETDNV